VAPFLYSSREPIELSQWLYYDDSTINIVRHPLPQDWDSQPQPKTAIAIISGKGKAIPTSNLAGTGPSEERPIKHFGEKGTWAYPGTAEIFGVPPIISGTAKATKFKFCTHILSIDRNNSPSEISGKVAVGVLRDSNFSGHPFIGRIAQSSLR